MKEVVRVACGIIVHQGLVLCAQRGPAQQMPMMWEFPGGKIEKGEQEEDCLIREIFEELRLKVELVRKMSPNRHLYASGMYIELIPYLCKYESGEINAVDHHDIRWLKPEDLPILDWCEADVPIVQEFLHLRSTGVLAKFL
jgi:8-oxo-dGTP diphosphatase